MTPPLHPIFRAMRRNLILAMLVGVGVTGLVAWSAVFLDFAVKATAIVCAIGIFWTFINAISLKSIPQGFVLVADRPLRWEGRIHGDQLARHLVKIDQHCSTPKFSTFVESAIRKGAARHNPALFRGVAECLATAQEFGEKVREGLCGLANALAHIESNGARCCLIPTNSWSGAIETNLNLYFVTY